MSKGGLSTADLQRGAKRLNHASVIAESKSTKTDDLDQEAISSLGERGNNMTSCLLITVSASPLGIVRLVSLLICCLQSNYTEGMEAILTRCEQLQFCLR